MNIHLQLQQTINLLLLLFLAQNTANLYLPWSKIAIILVFTLLLEHLLLYLPHKKINYISFSSITTGVGVILMMVTSYLWMYLFVITLGLLQKHFLKIEDRHFFNPSNFALLAGMIFFYDDAHLVLGQLGDALWLNAIVVVMAVALLIRAKRWVIPLIFVVSYVFFQYLWVISYDPVLTVEQVTDRFYSVSFIVFILFMLTDPKTTPDSIGQQMIFTLALVMVATLLDRYQGFRVQHLFISLFCLSPLVPLLVTWQNYQERKKLLLMTSLLVILVLSVSIRIESKEPYYFAMDH